jgi:hypothetical protein
MPYIRKKGYVFLEGIYQFRENKLSYVIYPRHIWWVYLDKTKWSTQHWRGAHLLIPAPTERCGYQKIVVSLEKMVFIKFTISTHEVQRLCWCYTSEKTQVWVQACINSNWTSQVYQTICSRSNQSRGAPESHSILPCCMNKLYKTAQALQLYKQQKASTDRRQEDDDWIHSQLQTTKRNPTKPTKLCNNMCSPILLLRTCVQL